MIRDDVSACVARSGPWTIGRGRALGIVPGSGRGRRCRGDGSTGPSGRRDGVAGSGAGAIGGRGCDPERRMGRGDWGWDRPTRSASRPGRPRRAGDGGVERAGGGSAVERDVSGPASDGRTCLYATPAPSATGFDRLSRFFPAFGPGPLSRSSLTSSQFGPAARSTSRGTLRSSAEVIASRTSVGQARGSRRRGPRRRARRGSGAASAPRAPRSRMPRSTSEHRPLDQVGGRALDHGVDGRPLGEVAGSGRSCS